MAEVTEYNEMDQGKLEGDLRIGFIRKVYGILSAQILLTCLFVVVGVTSTEFQETIADNFWIILLAFFGVICSLIALFCCRNLARKVPINYILLGFFTACEALMVACICGFYDPISVLIAAIMTLSVTLGLTIYALTTKSDFSTKISIMLVIVISLVLFAIFFPIFYSDRYFNVVICTIYVLIYGIYLVIDTLLIAGKGRYKLSTEDYILGALAIYVDIIGLFVYLLRLFGRKR